MRTSVKHSFGTSCEACRLEKLRAALAAAGIESLGLNPFEIELSRDLSDDEQRALAAALDGSGMQLITDRKAALVEQMKRALEELIEAPKESADQGIREYLKGRFFYSYSYLSRLFTSSEHVSPEHYFIERKVERAKIYLSFGQSTLSEIATRLNYSSIAHLSHQFKQVTGKTAMEFKREQRGGQKNGIDTTRA